MALRAKKPDAIQKRLKLFLFGGAGVGKTTASIQWPKSYIVDAERGAENYDQLITASGSVVMQSTDIDEVIDEVKKLMTEQHEYRTLVLDPITPLYQDLLDKCEQKVGSDFGRHYGEANKTMKRLSNLIMALDMNVIVTAHAKTEYGENMVKLGQTFDGWKRLDYLFDLVLELSKRGTKRMARVVKTRLAQFPDGDTFEWSYDSMADRYGRDIVEKRAETVELATAEQCAELNRLLELVNLPEGTVEKWLSKANVDSFEDMPSDAIAKCIAHVRGKLEGVAA